MTTKISKSLLESISNVVNSDSKNLTEASSYRSLDMKNVNKKNFANLDKFEAFVIGELTDAPIDSDDTETLYNLFKKGYQIAVDREGEDNTKNLKKDKFKPITGEYREEDPNEEDDDGNPLEINISFWAKAPAGMK